MAERLFDLGPRVTRASLVKPYERAPSDPVHRSLRIFAFDPSETRLLGNVATVNVPYEPLEPGPCGRVLEVDGSLLDGSGTAAIPLDLELPAMMLSAGLEPTQSRPQFHMQMTYAVCMGVYHRFLKALGRTVAWGFDEAARPSRGLFRLRIRPIAENDENAYYDPETGELNFGYFESDPKKVVGRNLPGGFFFTSLGHDIVAHECTHALLDGLRSHFNNATHPDVPAFHEGFADIVAVLHRFSHADVIRKVLEASKGRLDVPALQGIGKQFGEASGDLGPIRLVNDGVDPKTGLPPRYDKSKEEHDRGLSLAAAVWEAFTRIYERKKRKYVLLATGGRGVFPDNEELPTQLIAVLVDLARELAEQFLNICIRAIDYCPPVDVRFGDYLRAAITADFDLVPDDPHGYREAWIDAFRRRGIYPQHVQNLGEDALLWRPPEKEIPNCRPLSFAELVFDGDPGHSPTAAELSRQATEVGKLVTARGTLDEFGLCDHNDPQVKKMGKIDPPCVESVRVARRVGPNGEVGFDLVAEVTQRVLRVLKGRKRPIEVFGGSTVIFDARGKVRYVVRKGLFNDKREQEMADFVEGDGRAYWHKSPKGNFDMPKRGIARTLHDRRRTRGKS